MSVFRAPHPVLAACVVGDYQGWIECTRRPLVRREVPGCFLPLILNLGPPFRLASPGGEPALYSSFTAGLHTQPTVVEPTDRCECVQVNLTPLGALRIFGLPLASISNRVVPFDDVFGSGGQTLLDRLKESRAWEERFALIDAFLLARMETSRAISPQLVRTWRRLVETDGNVTVAELAGEIGYSRRRLTAQVHEHFGLPPKALARIVRFNATLREANGGDPCWGAIARRRGYFDQAHFVRDFTILAGISPGEYLRRRLSDGGIAAG